MSSSDTMQERQKREREQSRGYKLAAGSHDVHSRCKYPYGVWVADYEAGKWSRLRVTALLMRYEVHNKASLDLEVSHGSSRHTRCDR